jgi:hypothetical protein
MRRILLAIVVGAMGVACHTITEEMPTRPGPINVGGGQPIAPPPAPTIVIPVPAPTPEPGPQLPPSNPAPAPNNPPAHNPGGFPPGQIPSNTNPVARLGAKVFFLECNGQQVPGSDSATETRVGCRIHFDVTPKDANNAHTQVRHVPTWTFVPSDIAGGVGSKQDFTPTVSATGRGVLTAFCTADGVRSNDVRITIR